MKLIVLSFDDGETADRFWAERLRFYGLHASFALCCGFLGQSGVLADGRRWQKTSAEEMRATYRGFELCSHGFYHRDFTALTARGLRQELCGDVRAIARYGGQRVRTAVYPGGRSDARAAAVLRACGFVCARTAEPSYSVAPPADLLRFAPSCHLLDPAAPRLLAALEGAEGDAVLSLYAHSYELAEEGARAAAEALLAALARARGARSVSLGEAARLLRAAKDVPRGDGQYNG